MGASLTAMGKARRNEGAYMPFMPFIYAQRCQIHARSRTHTCTLMLAYNQKVEKKKKKKTIYSTKRGKSQVECPEITFTYTSAHIYAKWINSILSNTRKPTNMIVHFDKSLTKVSVFFLLHYNFLRFIFHGWCGKTPPALNIDLWACVFFFFPVFY